MGGFQSLIHTHTQDVLDTLTPLWRASQASLLSDRERFRKRLLTNTTVTVKCIWALKPSQHVTGSEEARIDFVFHICAVISFFNPSAVVYCTSEVILVYGRVWLFGSERLSHTRRAVCVCFSLIFHQAFESQTHPSFSASADIWSWDGRVTDVNGRLVSFFIPLTNKSNYAFWVIVFVLSDLWKKCSQWWRQRTSKRRDHVSSNADILSKSFEMEATLFSLSWCWRAGRLPSGNSVATWNSFFPPDLANLLVPPWNLTWQQTFGCVPLHPQ